MSWQTLIDSAQRSPTMWAMNDNVAVAAENLLNELANASPNIYWYPGSGDDLTPIVLDAPNNRTGKRLYPLRGNQQNEPLILWMSDYADHLVNFPTGPWNRHISLENAGHAPVEAQLEIIEPIHRFFIPGQTVGNLGRLFTIPMAVFTVRVSGGHERYERPAGGDIYTIVFTPAESRILLNQVFLPHGLQIRVVALQRQGGCQAAHFLQDGFEQYRDLPRLLAEHIDILGRVEAYLVDHNVRVPDYHMADHFPMPLMAWGVEGTRVWVPYA